MSFDDENAAVYDDLAQRGDEAETVASLDVAMAARRSGNDGKGRAVPAAHRAPRGHPHPNGGRGRSSRLTRGMSASPVPTLITPLSHSSTSHPGRPVAFENDPTRHGRRLLRRRRRVHHCLPRSVKPASTRGAIRVDTGRSTCFARQPPALRNQARWASILVVQRAPSRRSLVPTRRTTRSAPTHSSKLPGGEVWAPKNGS